MRWVNRYRQSGLSQREFARRHGLNVALLRYWIYGGAQRRARDRSAVRPPALQELDLGPLLGRPRWGAEVVLANGTTIRLATEVTPELVGRLLELPRCSP